MQFLEGFVKSLFWLSNGLLLATYISAWFQNELALRFHLPGGIAFHVTAATLSIFVLLFANISSIFYFVGTGRWIKDQAHLLMAQRRREMTEKVWALYEKANRLKALPMPFGTFALVLGLFTFIMGGAHQMQAIPPWIHPTLATLLLALNLTSHWATFRCIRKNLVILDECSNLMEAETSPHP
jgi:hypothetical protein